MQGAQARLFLGQALGLFWVLVIYTCAQLLRNLIGAHQVLRHIVGAGRLVATLALFAALR